MSASQWPYHGYQSPLSLKPVKATTGTIVIDRMMAYVPVNTTAGAAALTLARPTKAGIVATVILTVDGGDLTLTVTGGYNAVSNTSITFDDAGDRVTFISVDIGGTMYWRVLDQEGTNATLGMSPGAGFTSGVGGFYISSIERIGTLYKTSIMFDLTGLASSTTDTDIIGVGTSPAHFGQITEALNGTLVYGQVTCLETPATGADDIDFYFAVEGTGVFSGLITDLDETAMYQKGSAAAGAAATQIALTALPTANTYMYAACGEGSVPATYTAGQFLFEFWGK